MLLTVRTLSQKLSQGPTLLMGKCGISGGKGPQGGVSLILLALLFERSICDNSSFLDITPNCKKTRGSLHFSVSDSSQNTHTHTHTHTHMEVVFL